MERILGILRGFVEAKALYLAADIGVADLIAEGVDEVDQLAKRSGCDEDALLRVLRALCSIEVFAEPSEGRFTLGRDGECLRSGVTGSLRNWIRINGGPIFRAFADAEYSLRTGKPSFGEAHGASFFDYLERDPHDGPIFDAAMSDFVSQANETLLDVYGFDGVRTVVDVGGGSGALVAEILRRHPSIRGVLFDQPHVVERAREGTVLAGLDGRLEIAGGSFFERIVGGADAYILSWILHDWNDPEALMILGACRRAMRPGARLLIFEAIIPDHDEPHFSRFGDIVMLVALGGRERTRREYERLLNRSGFALRRVIETASPRSLLEAEAIEVADV
jgi:hypothetical protein